MGLNLRIIMNRNIVKKIIFAAAIVSSFSSTAAQVAYISDDLPVYLRRGPGEQYGFSGTLNSGTQVTILDEQDKFSRIQDNKGRISWVESSSLNKTPSFRVRIPQLEKEIASLTEQLEDASKGSRNQVSSLNDKIAKNATTLANLEKENQTLKQELTKSNRQMETLNNRLDNERRDLILQWFLYGGTVAGGGLLLGLIIPYLIPRRRKSRGHWTN